MRRVLFIAAVTIVCSPTIPLGAVTPVQGAWDVLNKAMSGGEDSRRQALEALGMVDPGNEQAVKTLVDALQDKDPLVRESAASALGNMKARQAIGSLRDAISDKGEVAFAAAKALADMGDSGGRDMFVAMIAGERSDAPGIVASGIRDAKKRLKHPQGLLLMGAEDATGAFFGPASYGITAAKEAFKEKGASSRAVAAFYLSKDPDPYAVTLLEWALSDNNWGVRTAAAKGLATRGNDATVPKLQFLLDDPHNPVRTMAAAAILRITDRQSGMDSAAVDKH
jgi:HEAT repeat protein